MNSIMLVVEIVSLLLISKIPFILMESGCPNIPESNYTGASTQLPIDMLMRDLKSFNEHFKDKFEEMIKYIRKNQNKVEELDVKYFLFTPQNLNEPQNLTFTEKSLERSYFNPTYPTTIIIHGFTLTVNINAGILSYIKDFLLKEYLLNVIVVDYSKYSQSLYSQAVRDGYLVAENIASFIRFLERNSYVKAEYYHVIGMSLGGQISGIVGQYVPGLGRITGLDPAGPLYERFPPNYRLSSGDAEFVDVIHTGCAQFPYGLSICHPSGDIDFYPNGGRIQPKCGSSENSSATDRIDSKIIAATLCSHERAILLYLESICSVDCDFIGVSCDSYENFQKGLCNVHNSHIAIMGNYASKRYDLPPGLKFYLNTNSHFPYCKKARYSR